LKYHVDDILDDGISYSLCEKKCYIKNPKSNEELCNDKALESRENLTREIKRLQSLEHEKELAKKGIIAPSHGGWGTDVVPWTILQTNGLSGLVEGQVELVFRRAAKRWGRRVVDEEREWYVLGHPSPFDGNHQEWVECKADDNSNFITSGAFGEVCITGCSRLPNAARFLLRVNRNKTWSMDNTGSNSPLEFVVTHEFGHVWNEIGHTSCSQCIMNATLQDIPADLVEGDPGDMVNITAAQDGIPDNAKWVADTDGWKTRQLDWEAESIVDIWDDRQTRLGDR